MCVWVSSYRIKSAGSDVFVLPVLGVVYHSLPLTVGVQSVIGRHARWGQMGREFAVETMEYWSLGGDFRSLRAYILGARPVDDRCEVFIDICNRQKTKQQTC